MLSFNDLVNGFKQLGLANSDIVMVHSSYKSFGEVDGGPQTVIDALLAVIGKDGTLVMPTYTLDFCVQYNTHGKGYFDVDNSPSEMGVLTELLRKMSGSKRSINPIHSVAVYGKLKNELTLIGDKNSYSKESVFAKLHQLNAKLMIIGLTFQQSLTFFHYVEQMIPVDYRHLKKFSGTIVVDGREYEDTYQLFVKNIVDGKRVMANYDPLGEILEKNGIVKTQKIGSSIVKLLNARDVYEISEKELKRNPRLVYWIEEEK